MWAPDAEDPRRSRPRGAFAAPATRVKDTTQRAIGPAVVVGQIFGLLPVHNITDYSGGANGLTFTFFSIRSIIAAILIAISCGEVALFLRRLVLLGFSVGGVTATFFFSSTTSTAVLMFRLVASGRFKRLMLQFEKMERIFTNNEAYPEPKTWTLCRKIRLLSGIVICTGIVEHSFFITAKMTNVTSQIKKCNFQIFFYEHFLRTERKHLFTFFPFSYFIAMPFEITNTCNTIAWTFLDLLIMLFSIALAHRFQQISSKIQKVLLQQMPDKFWFEMREDFVTLQELVGSVDHQFAYIILLSCGTDVYFTCLLLFSSFTAPPEPLNKLYFYFSIIFIISRTLMTLYFATTVHEEGRRPYMLLKRIPHYAWGPEVERFSYQLSCEVVALSGNQFFYFTRNVILTLVGTIITYELVILEHILEQPEVVQQSCELSYN